MEATYRTDNGRLTFKISGEDVKAIFKQIATVQEVFDTENKCGLCGGEDIRFLARKVDDYDFYELACQRTGCRARFAFGQAKKGGALFPKHKDADGNWLEHGGWSKYDKGGDGQPSGPQPVAHKGAPTPAEKKNGVPVYATWEDAQGSPNWGQQWLDVGGVIYKLGKNREYEEVQRTGA